MKVEKIASVFVIVLLITALTSEGNAAEVGSQEKKGRSEKSRVVELTLHPAKVVKSAKKYHLLPKPEEQSDSDAPALYLKAVQALPKNLQTKQISQWIKAPLNQLPQKQVQSTLQQLKPSLALVEQAAKCKRCDWAAAKADAMSGILAKYKLLAHALALQSRQQIAQGQYDKAIDSIQAGFAMSRHISQGPTMIDGLVGIAIGALMCGQLEQFVQGPDAPNLYTALQELPKPLVDLTEQEELQYLEDSARQRVHSIMNRFDRHLAMLQCVEALRLYAGVHDGKFPNKLSEITEVAIANDPVSKKPFIYRRTGSKAVLERPSVKGIIPKDMISYKLTLKE